MRCELKAHTGDAARAVVELTAGTVAYRCRACDGIHVGERDEVGPGEVRLFSNRHGRVMIYLESKIEGAG